jgi:hypothetical protein
MSNGRQGRVGRSYQDYLLGLCPLGYFLVLSPYNHKYLRDIPHSVTNNNLRYYTLFGLLLVTVTATIAASSLLWPVTMSVLAQTAADDGDAAPMASGENATANTTAPDSTNMTGAKFLFIQGAQSGSVSEVNATTSTLELSDVSDKTIMFSDRPDRIVGSANTTDFIGHWNMGPNSFAVDPPNAVLVLDDEDQREELAVIELYNPQYDPEANTLKYDITVENATATATTSSINLPGEFGQSTLVIDDDEDDGISYVILDDNTGSADVPSELHDDVRDSN